MKMLELRGLKAVRIYQLYQQILIAYAVLPTTRAKSIKDFLCDFENKNVDKKRDILRCAAMFYDFSDDDLKNILDFAVVEPTNIEASQQVHLMAPDDIITTVADVLLKCSEIKTFFWTGNEQTESPTFQSN